MPKFKSTDRIPIMLMILLLSSGACANDLVGQASIVDGDTLDIHGTRIRLWGVDAPESSQLCRGADSDPYRCGAKAANDLDSFIARRPVNCMPVAEDQYGRTVATCSVGGADIRECPLAPQIDRCLARQFTGHPTDDPEPLTLIFFTRSMNARKLAGTWRLLG